ncbi:MAG TPA: primosomal protein N' [Chromatiales bacterium]|nr:primosomal protein N' [Chromatiales bacterium]
MSVSQKQDKIIQVALPTPVGDWFDYLPGDNPIDRFEPGCRVKVSFGRQKLVGIVIGTTASSKIPRHQLKPILALLETEAIIPPRILKLIKRAASYYHHPLGEALATALPKLLRQGKSPGHTDLTFWQPTKIGLVFDLKKLSRAPKQTACLELFRKNSAGLSEAQLNEKLPGWRQAISALEKKGLVESCQRPCLETEAVEQSQPGPALNQEQQLAVEKLSRNLDGFSTTLLQGVTGSGKTEVYLHIIQQILQQDKQVLVLVPEISLTPQLRQRFEQRLGIQVVSLHSGLNDSERLYAWRMTSSGIAKVIIGTRSAVFVPLKKPGLILVDEEHDTSLKQQEGFRYHARDLAVLRGQLENIPVLLGSATPSLETLAKAQKNDYKHLQLTQRAGKARPPLYTLIDLRRQQLTAGLSSPLVHRMREVLEKNQQVLLFINRRGFAPAMLCHDCGHIFDCPRCDAHTTFHAASNKLRCHHCGHVSTSPVVCPECDSKTLVTTGVGTEQIEKSVREYFPDENIIRVDRDTMRKKNALSTALNDIAAGKYSIIIGTQLLAKGHDFPNITLVGMIDVDQGLYSVDFRAPERLGQQILQVGGRAGRGAKNGEVIIQTHQPDHHLLQTLLNENFDGFSNIQLKERKLAQLPPYSHLALIRSAAMKPEAAQQFLHQASKIFRQHAKESTQIMGPVPAPMEKRAGRYRQQLLIQSSNRSELHNFLNKVLPLLKALKSSRKTRWSVDIDPVELN